MEIAVLKLHELSDLQSNASKIEIKNKELEEIMGLFSKAEYMEVDLPFTYDNNSEDRYACIISIEAYGRILDDYKYCNASFEVNQDDYEELSSLLITADIKQVKVIVKVKNGVVKSFKIDLKDLAQRYNDSRLEKLSLLGWGLNDSSFID